MWNSLLIQRSSLTRLCFLIGISVAMLAGEVFADFDSAEIHRVRVGLHPGKTRVVIDLNAITDFSYAIVPGVGFHVSFPEVTAGPTSYPSVGVIESTSFDPMGKGGDLLIRTATPVEFVKVFRLGPDNSGGHRIVLDLRQTQNWQMPLPEPLAVQQQSAPQQSMPVQQAIQSMPTQKAIPASLSEDSQAFWRALGMLPQEYAITTPGTMGNIASVNAPVAPVSPAAPIQSTIDPVTWKAMVRAQNATSEKTDAWWSLW